LAAETFDQPPAAFKTRSFFANLLGLRVALFLALLGPVGEREEPAVADIGTVMSSA